MCVNEPFKLLRQIWLRNKTSCAINSQLPQIPFLQAATTVAITWHQARASKQWAWHDVTECRQETPSDDVTPLSWRRMRDQSKRLTLQRVESKKREGRSSAFLFLLSWRSRKIHIHNAIIMIATIAWPHYVRLAHCSRGVSRLVQIKDLLSNISRQSLTQSRSVENKWRKSAYFLPLLPPPSRTSTRANIYAIKLKLLRTMKEIQPGYFKIIGDSQGPHFCFKILRQRKGNGTLEIFV